MCAVVKEKLCTYRGASIIEILVTLALIAIISKVVISNLKGLQNPIANASFQVSHYLRLVRSRAISQTLAIKVAPVSQTRIVASAASSCSDTTAYTETSLTLNMPATTSFTSTNWSICFNQRGLASQNVSFSILDTGGRTRTIEIALGGGVQIR